MDTNQVLLNQLSNNHYKQEEKKYNTIWDGKSLLVKILVTKPIICFITCFNFLLGM